MLLGFFVWGVLLAPAAVFAELKTCLDSLLILLRIIVDAMAHGTFHFDQVFLRHRGVVFVAGE